MKIKQNELEINKQRVRKEVKTVMLEGICDTITNLEAIRPTNPNPNWNDIREEISKKLLILYKIREELIEEKI